MNNKLSLSNMPTNYLNDFIVKNKCDCSCEVNDYIRIVPKEFDDMYLDLYKQLIYNINIIKYVGSKKTLLSLINDIDNILIEFCKIEYNYSEYGEDKIFYACIPFYCDYNKISTIKISDGIDFSGLISINLNTDVLTIDTICNNLIEKISKYLIS